MKATPKMWEDLEKKNTSLDGDIREIDVTKLPK